MIRADHRAGSLHWAAARVPRLVGVVEAGHQIALVLRVVLELHRRERGGYPTRGAAGLSRDGRRRRPTRAVVLCHKGIIMGYGGSSPSDYLRASKKMVGTVLEVTSISVLFRVKSMKIVPVVLSSTAVSCPMLW